MDKKEIKIQIETLLKNENILEVKAELNKIKDEVLQSILKEEKELDKQQENIDVELKIDSEELKLNQEIKALFNKFSQKLKEEKAKKDANEKSNLLAKRTLIEEFQNLIDTDKNIGSAISKIKEIREKWNDIGNIPRDKYQEIQNEYSKLNDEFNYNISIYKELKENDLKRNYSLKNQIIFELEKLTTNNNIREVELAYRSLQNDWNEIGGTFQDKWEELKEKYWNNIHKISERLKQHYKAKKVEREENFIRKSELLEEVKTFTQILPKTHKDWEKATKSILDFQTKWRKIGSTPKEKGNRIWDDFRATNDAFFTAKSEFYSERNSQFKGNAQAKTNLLEKAKKLLEKDDLEYVTKQIKHIQNEWKKIGHAGKFAEQKLWKQLREISDEIFDKKKSAFNKLKEEETENLKIKEKFIKEIESLKLPKDPKKAVSELKAISDKFNSFGNVPFKQKDSIYKSYKVAIDKQYKALGLSDEEKEKIIFDLKLESSDGNVIDVLRKERKHIYNQISKFESEIKQLENNMSLFTVSKSSEGLFKGVEENIKNLNDKINALQQRLILIKEKENKLKTESEVSSEEQD